MGRINRRLDWLDLALENQSADYVQKITVTGKKHKVAPSGFHHVVLMVDDAFPMALIRDEHQEIIAMTSVKMSHETARKLKMMLDEYLDNYQDGGDMFMYTLEGKFR